MCVERAGEVGERPEVDERPEVGTYDFLHNIKGDTNRNRDYAPVKENTTIES